MQFKRYKGNPIIPRTPGTFYSTYSANPDVIFFKGKYHFYFRGQGADGHDQIGVAYAAPESFDGIHWEMYKDNPIIGVGDKDEFDSDHVLDPAAIEFKGKIYLYYTAHFTKAARSSTGLAISEDGTHFTKRSKKPVIQDIAPEAVVKDGKVFLFASHTVSGGYFEINRYESSDGINFPDDTKKVVFQPSGIKGEFDRFSVTTVRIWEEAGWYYMTYAGCGEYYDYPSAIGLARSKDLLNWQRYPQNPIFWRGEPGTWDEGALWFGTVCKVGRKYYMWYEGGGSGMGLDTPEGREASKLAREGNYGGYGKTTFSQIGLAYFEGEMLNW
jgi:beta-xylosidase